MTQFVNDLHVRFKIYARYDCAGFFTPLYIFILFFSIFYFIPNIVFVSISSHNNFVGFIPLVFDFVLSLLSLFFLMLQKSQISEVLYYVIPFSNPPIRFYEDFHSYF